MKTEFKLSKNDAICKTCGGFGVLGFVTGLVMCLLPEYNLMMPGLLMYIAGLAVVFEAFAYLLQIKSERKPFAGAIFMVGLALTIVGSYGLFAMTIPAVLALILVAFGEVLVIYEVN